LNSKSKRIKKEKIKVSKIEKKTKQEKKKSIVNINYLLLIKSLFTVGSNATYARNGFNFMMVLCSIIIYN